MSSRDLRALANDNGDSNRLCVSISTPTRFHLFHLASELQARNALGQLLCGYPTKRIPASLRRHSVRCPWLIVPAQLASRWCSDSARPAFDEWVIEAYDRWASRRMSAADIVVTLSGRGLMTMRAAKRAGALTICDRGSTHILSQDTILREEHAQWGFAYQGISSAGIARELAEYDEADFITVPSEFARSTFIQHSVAAEKVKVIRYGVDVDLFRPASEKESGFRILFVGQIGIRKGVLYLLEALKRLRLPGAELILVGPTSPEMATRIREYGTGVRLAGILRGHALAEVFRQSTVFVMPSVEEGLALVIGQALASGLPVIATTNSGAGELITDGEEGFVVPARSVSALCERLELLYENRQRTEMMGRNARTRAERLGGWRNYGSTAYETYAHMVARGAVSHGC